MCRPPLEVAEVIRAAGQPFLERAQMCFSRQHWKALNGILRCRTAALGGHIDECSRCGRRVLSYNSCRNRHCPKCQGNARHRWVQARRADLTAEPVRSIVKTLLRTGKLLLHGGSADNQPPLFAENEGDDNARHHE